MAITKSYTHIYAHTNSHTHARTTAHTTHHQKYTRRYNISVQYQSFCFLGITIRPCSQPTEELKQETVTNFPEYKPDISRSVDLT